MQRVPQVEPTGRVLWDCIGLHLMLQIHLRGGTSSWWSGAFGEGERNTDVILHACYCWPVNGAIEETFWASERQRASESREEKKT